MKNKTTSICKNSFAISRFVYHEGPHERPEEAPKQKSEKFKEKRKDKEADSTKEKAESAERLLKLRAEVESKINTAWKHAEGEGWTEKKFATALTNYLRDYYEHADPDSQKLLNGMNMDIEIKNKGGVNPVSAGYLFSGEPRKPTVDYWRKG